MVNNWIDISNKITEDISSRDFIKIKNRQTPIRFSHYGVDINGHQLVGINIEFHIWLEYIGRPLEILHSDREYLYIGYAFELFKPYLKSIGYIEFESHDRQGFSKNLFNKIRDCKIVDSWWCYSNGDVISHLKSDMIKYLNGDVDKLKF